MSEILLCGDCFCGADTGAGAAVQAEFRVDAIDIAFFDCSGGALALAGAACHTEVGIDFVSHSSVIFVCCCFPGANVHIIFNTRKKTVSL
jgi:hypothetical protein